MITKRKTRSDIEDLRPKIIPILKEHQVARAAIFGSHATGTAKETSDVDILIEFEGEKNLLDLAALKLDLEAALKRKVDVTTYRGLHPLIKKRVLKQQIRVL